MFDAKEIKTRLELVKNRKAALEIELTFLKEEESALDTLAEIYSNRAYDPIQEERKHSARIVAKTDVEQKKIECKVRINTFGRDEVIALLRSYGSWITVKELAELAEISEKSSANYLSAFSSQGIAESRKAKGITGTRALKQYRYNKGERSL